MTQATKSAAPQATFLSDSRLRKPPVLTAPNINLHNDFSETLKTSTETAPSNMVPFTLNLSQLKTIVFSK